MHVVRRIALFFLILPALEVAVFVAVALSIGFWKATLLSIATSVAGAILLKIAGQPRLRQFQSSLAGGQTTSIHLGGGEMFTVLAGLLLLIPGFLTDLLALLLLVPALRRRFGGMAGDFIRTGGNRPAEPGVIDLEPGEWRDEPQGSIPRGGQTPPRQP
jgi:UPF0716 protein FxsA